MSEDRRSDERARREAAQAHRGEVVPDSGRALKPRALPQMVSVRLESELASELRQLARETGTTVSDLLREAAVSVVVRAKSARYVVRMEQVVGGHAQALPTGNTASFLEPQNSAVGATT